MDAGVRGTEFSNTPTAANRKRGLIQRKGMCADRRTKPLRQAPRSVLIGTEKENANLLAAYATHDVVWPTAALQDKGKLPEYIVASAVAMGVVDLLKEIDIEHDTG